MAEEAIIISNEESVLLKQAIAKMLCRRGFEQSRISKILKLTQPMVSNYLSADNKMPEKINLFAEEAIKKIDENKDVEFCVCIIFSGRQIEGNYFIADKSELITDERQNIIENLNEAFMILKGRDITKIKPKIKMNIAMSLGKPKTREDVASFADGLVIIDNRFSSISPIRFGSSEHLASLLLYLKSEEIDANAIMNIKYYERFAGYRNTNLSRDYKLKKDKSNKKKKNPDILLHKGDFGIEPCAYVIGKDAADVAKKIVKIIEVI